MIILGIESSCDDTSVALVEATDAGFVVLAEKTASQIEVHKKYGGVVPEIAGRMHAEQIVPVVETVMTECRIQNSEFRMPDAIAVTSGPGLITGLLVGMEVAKTLSYLWDVPLVRTNHIEGHMLSVLLKEQGTKSKEQIEFPALALVVSGGHTELILMNDYGDYKIIGKTLDDAAGECFDKVAKLLGLDYPGGPKISKLALEGRTDAIPFPRPMIDSKDYNFSFAGLKTSALYWLRDNSLAQTPSPTAVGAPPQRGSGQGATSQTSVTLRDFCASFEQAITDVLVEKTLRAVEEYKPRTVLLGGGVSANKKLRNTLESKLKEFPNFPISLFPSPQYSMDNGAMIAVAGYFHAKKGEYTSWRDLKADPNWKVDAEPHLIT